MATRREVLRGAAGAGLAALSSAATADNDTTSKTFVLVHGTWHGGWVWRDVRTLLRERGHEVFTPTCTGCGEREHLARPDVGLDTHIEDICNVIRFEELEDIVLVGHSFAGMTITGVADRMRDRIGRIVFFDALVPREGVMAAVSRDPETGEYPEWWLERRKKFVDGFRMVLWEDYPVEMLVPPGMTEHVERLKRLITTHPARQWTDELTLNNGGWQGLPRAYVHCVGQKYRMSSDFMVGPARDPGWDFVELDAPRNAMMTHPDLVAETLARLAD
ncbi:MAG: alpha/beta hydrolase [Woeseiaceae bacterium]|nr:alpha/beta hydrolase [Woeseiaceae bacterium]